jgi:hypothetical protein
LADYINDKFMGALEQGALKAALMDWLKLLMFIDHIRNFASERTPTTQGPFFWISPFADLFLVANTPPLRFAFPLPSIFRRCVSSSSTSATLGFDLDLPCTLNITPNTLSQCSTQSRRSS